MDTELFIKEAIKEDVGAGDHTSLACIPDGKICKAEIISKDKGILAGIELARLIYQEIDPDIVFDPFYNDGNKVEKFDMVALIKGKARSILRGERLVLNFMQRMSGIATLTNKFVRAVKDYPAKILDTRKTTPLFREYEKWAVKIGGGENHRSGLYDMILIKDNHIIYSGGISQAIIAANGYLRKKKLDLKIEIEAASLSQVEEILAIGGVHRIMLDNFEPRNARRAVKMINKKFETEVSGGINLKNVSEYAATGVDYISVGALTHSYQSLDLTLTAI